MSSVAASAPPSALPAVSVASRAGVATVVHKFGGTSVADAEHILQKLRQINAGLKEAVYIYQGTDQRGADMIAGWR